MDSNFETFKQKITSAIADDMAYFTNMEMLSKSFGSTEKYTLFFSLSLILF